MLPNSTTPYTVYQFFNSSGALLYVGVTSDWTHRASDHRNQSEWYKDVADIRTAHFATPREAAIEERRLIAEANPIHNRAKGNRGWQFQAHIRHAGRAEGGAEVEAVEAATEEGLTTREAAQRAEVSERSIRAWIKNGDVTHYYDKQGIRRVPLVSLDKHLQRRGATPAEATRQASDPIPGLPELAATLEEQRKELRDLRWQNGYLTSQLEAAKKEIARHIEEKEQQRLLTSGAEAEPEPAAEVVDSPSEANEPPAGFWARVRSFMWGQP